MEEEWSAREGAGQADRPSSWMALSLDFILQKF